MQTQVMFYLLNDDNPATGGENSDVVNAPLFHAFNHACWQAAHFYRRNQGVFIYTQDQKNAHDIDEMLWAFEPDAFVPHNLVGEGPKNGAAVEISWQPPTKRRPILINLTSTVPNFAGQFSTIIDFVPVNESLKQLARDRFRAYRQLGFRVDNQPAPQLQQSIPAITS